MMQRFRDAVGRHAGPNSREGASGRTYKYTTKHDDASFPL